MSQNTKPNGIPTQSLNAKQQQQLLQQHLFQLATMQQGAAGGFSLDPNSMDALMADQLLQQHYFSSEPARLQNPTSYHVQQTFTKAADPTILIGLSPEDPPIKQEIDDLMDPFNSLVDEFGSSLSAHHFNNFGAVGLGTSGACTSNLLQQGQLHQQHTYNGTSTQNQKKQSALMPPTNLLSPLSSNSPLDTDDLDPLADDYNTPHTSGSLNNSPYSTTTALVTSASINHGDSRSTRSPTKRSSTRSAPNRVGQYMYSCSLPTTSSAAASIPRKTSSGNSHANPILGGHPSSFGAFGTGTRASAQPSTSVSDFASVAGTSYGDDESDTSVTPGSSKPSVRLDANERRRRRRESHNAVERRRRDNINEKIQELATLLPEYANLQAEGAPKPNKGMILRRSVDYLRHIVGVAHRLAERNRELEAVLKRICIEANIPETSLGLSLPLDGTNLFDPGLPSAGTLMNMDD
ncbi:hypothetical protein SeLEV6574_g02835 [Synchytrium endobioticum]|nr:hypothetical protein SeLEV6574_g02835 [Synchytrium endobioticum]